MKTVLVVGASRGLGLVFVRQYAASGLMAVHSPDEELYWQANAVLELENGSYVPIVIIDVTPENHAEIGSRAQHPDSPTNEDNC